MKALTCEMCGSTNLLKQDGVFVCQSCGTKYSVEEAKKMMVEGTVDVQGTVKVDTSDELKNLYEVARRAKDTNNNENAAKYYDMILVKDPNSWEAQFYVVFFKAMSCRIAEISSAAVSVGNCLFSVFDLIENNVTDEEEKQRCISEVSTKSIDIANMLGNAAAAHYADIDIDIRTNYYGELNDNLTNSMGICLCVADSLEKKSEDTYKDIIAICYQTVIHFIKVTITNTSFVVNTSGLKNLANEYAERVRKYDPNFELPYPPKNNNAIASNSNSESKSGCYVATAVYGSYDCPEVWTLRRFRDNTLAQSWYGRAFIHAYYAISPTLVKWFGHTSWFKKMWKEPLDNLVQKLQSNGVESTPYNDPNYK